jgi:hypothetical protein
MIHDRSIIIPNVPIMFARVYSFVRGRIRFKPRQIRCGEVNAMIGGKDLDSMAASCTQCLITGCSGPAIG